MKKEDYDALKEKALEQLMKGEPLFGKDGAFAPMLKDFLDAALEAEMKGHLDEEERGARNKRNGYKTKKVKSSQGTLEIKTPQDRKSNFEPSIVKKRQTILADSLEKKILGLYGLGMSYRDISAHIEEMYDTKISHDVLSDITDRILPRM